MLWSMHNMLEGLSEVILVCVMHIICWCLGLSLTSLRQTKDSFYSSVGDLVLILETLGLGLGVGWVDL